MKNLCHPDFKFYSQVDTPLNSEQFIVQEKGHMDAFPGFTMRIHEIFARDDKVACYLIFEGVQTREFLGHPASGRKVRFSLMFMITLKDGKYIIIQRISSDSCQPEWQHIAQSVLLQAGLRI